MVGSGAREHALVWKCVAVRRSSSASTARRATAAPAAWRATWPSAQPTWCASSTSPSASGSGLSCSGRRRRSTPAWATRCASAGFNVFGPNRGAGPHRVEQGLRQGADEARRTSRPPTSTSSPSRRRRRRGRDERGGRVAVKADGLARGKGVIVCASARGVRRRDRRDAASRAASARSGATIVVEERLRGARAFAARRDRRHRACVPLAPARDYKRAHEGDAGPEHRRHGRLLAAAWRRR